MARIGTNYEADANGTVTITHFSEDDLGRLASFHDGESPCPVCVAEHDLQMAERAFSRALSDWARQQRESARKV